MVMGSNSNNGNVPSDPAADVVFMLRHDFHIHASLSGPRLDAPELAEGEYVVALHRLALLVEQMQLAKVHGQIHAGSRLG